MSFTMFGRKLQFVRSREQAGAGGVQSGPWSHLQEREERDGVHLQRGHHPHRLRGGGGRGGHRHLLGEEEGPAHPHHQHHHIHGRQEVLTHLHCHTSTVRSFQIQLFT